MHSPSAKRFVSVEVFHAIVSETDLGPAPLIDDEYANPAESFDTIKMMREGGPLSEELRVCAQRRIGTPALVTRISARAKRERVSRRRQAVTRTFS